MQIIQIHFIFAWPNFVLRIYVNFLEEQQRSQIEYVRQKNESSGTSREQEVSPSQPTAVIPNHPAV